MVRENLYKTMSDVLAHYALSYLVASRVVKLRRTMLFALIGLLLGIDALLRIHRWIKYSIILAVTVVLIAAIPLIYINNKYLEYLVLASALYILHIVLEVFTATTPILWPITGQAYMLEIEPGGVIAEDSIRVNLRLL